MMPLRRRWQSLTLSELAGLFGLLRILHLQSEPDRTPAARSILCAADSGGAKPSPSCAGQSFAGRHDGGLRAGSSVRIFAPIRCAIYTRQSIESNADLSSCQFNPTCAVRSFSRGDRWATSFLWLYSRIYG